MKDARSLLLAFATLLAALPAAAQSPSDRLQQILDRGTLRVGMKADVVVFDPAKIRDTSTYEDPHHYAEGISDVLVNGVPVLRAGRMTESLPGRVLRR